MAYHDVVVVTNVLYLSLQRSQLVSQLLVLDDDRRGTLEQPRRSHSRNAKLMAMCVHWREYKLVLHIGS